MAALVIALAPVGLLSGLLFRTAAVLYAGKGRTLAGAYGIESAGALAGGLLATLCLRWGIQNFPLAVACSLIAAIAALFLFRRGGVLLHRGIAAGLATLMAILLWQAAPLDRRMTAWNHPGLLDTRDSPYGRITVDSPLRTGLRFHRRRPRLRNRGDGGGTLRPSVSPAACQPAAYPRPRRGARRDGARAPPASAGADRRDRARPRPDHDGPEPPPGHHPELPLRPRSPSHHSRSAAFPERKRRRLRPDPHRHAGTLLGPGQPLLYAGILPRVRRTPHSRRRHRAAAPYRRKFLDAAIDPPDGEHPPRPCLGLSGSPRPAGDNHRDHGLPPPPSPVTGYSE